jgi:HAD superfamily hydrolase (TIGR01509 family)
MLRAVIFDLDDTLLDWSNRAGDWEAISRGHIRPVYDHVSKAVHPMPTLDEFLSAFSSSLRDRWQGVGPPEWNSPHHRDVLRQTLQRVSLDPTGIDLDRCLQLYGWDAIPGVRPFPYVHGVLGALRAAGILLGLITNSSMPMWLRDREMETYGLRRYFAVRITAADIGKLKPHPLPFQHVLAELRAEPKQALVVGDRLRDDIAGAHNAGLRGVWSRSPYHEQSDDTKPDATIDSLADLLPLLDEWHPGWRGNGSPRSQ